MGEEDLHHEYTIAVELYKSGEYTDALALMERISEVRPSSRHVMYTRALCLVALGRVGEARAVRDRLSGDKRGPKAHEESGCKAS
jgi:thioredoxin-like negative regulator of GroEL